MHDFRKGVHELGDGLFSYLQPDGSWGLSNAGLVTGDGTSLLVDTFFTLRQTREMLDAFRPITAVKPIGAALNTHGNGDHCFGNQLLPDDTEIYATVGTYEHMQAVPASATHALVTSDHGPEWNEFVAEAFSAFDLSDIEMRMPTNVFDVALSLGVGGRQVDFLLVGPAHTKGDTIAHVPDADVVFTGDICFIGGTPVMWAGTIETMLAACDRILALEPGVVVPGHGPITDVTGVHDTRRYWEFVDREARARFAAGMSASDAADDIDLGEFADWGESERIIVNVEQVYKELDPTRPSETVHELLLRMARWRAQRR